MKSKLKFLMMLLLVSNFAESQEIFTSDYIALTTPQHNEGEIWYINDSLLQEVKNIANVKSDKSVLRSFPNLVSNVTVYELNKEGKLEFTGISVSAKDKVYEVIYDYSQTQTLVWTENDKTYSALIGVGVRMVAKVRTKKKGVNLTSPFSLTANMEKIEGTLEVRVSGIVSEKINGIIPTTTDLSPSSIAVALQAVATIKSHIYADDTIITPQYLAYTKSELPISAESLKNFKIDESQK